MADYIMLPGCRTIYVADLRQRADLLSMQGKHEEGQLLHALLDAHLARGAVSAEVREARDERRDLEKELDVVEKRADSAEDRVDDLETAIAEAMDRLQIALGAVAKTQPTKAKTAIADALATLASTRE